MKHILFSILIITTVNIQAQSICIKVVPEKIERIIKRIQIVPERIEQVCVPATYSYEYETILIQKGYWKGDLIKKCLVWQDAIYKTIQKQVLLTSAYNRTIVTPAIFEDVIVYDIQRDARTIEGDCQ